MKGVAVPYIIAILLGVAVIGFIGYWLFFAGGRLPQSDCETAQRQWCTQWFSLDTTLNENTVTTKKPVKPSTYPTGCKDVTKAICNGLGIG